MFFRRSRLLYSLTLTFRERIGRKLGAGLRAVLFPVTFNDSFDVRQVGQTLQDDAIVRSDEKILVSTMPAIGSASTEAIVIARAIRLRASAGASWSSAASVCSSGGR